MQRQGGQEAGVQASCEHPGSRMFVPHGSLLPAAPLGRLAPHTHHPPQAEGLHLRHTNPPDPTRIRQAPPQGLDTC